MVSQRPVISFDLDGVLAAPPFNWNPAINRDLTLMPIEQPLDAPPRVLRPVDRLLARSWYQLRYVARRTRPGALDAVRAAARNHSVIVLTGRSVRGRRQTQAWLEREGFASHLNGLIANASRLNSVRHKERALVSLDVAVHIDDDAATAALLARRGIPVALLDWPRNRNLAFPAGVTRYTDMDELAAAIAAMNQAS